MQSFGIQEIKDHKKTISNILFELFEHPPKKFDNLSEYKMHIGVARHIVKVLSQPIKP